MKQNEAYLTGILKCSAIGETASRPLVDEAHPSKHHCREDIPGGYCWPKYEQLMAGEGTSPSMYDMSIDNSLGDVRISVSGIDAVLSLTVHSLTVASWFTNVNQPAETNAMRVGKTWKNMFRIRLSGFVRKWGIPRNSHALLNIIKCSDPCHCSNSKM